MEKITLTNGDKFYNVERTICNRSRYIKGLIEFKEKKVSNRKNCKENKENEEEIYLENIKNSELKQLVKVLKNPYKPIKNKYGNFLSSFLIEEEYDPECQNSQCLFPCITIYTNKKESQILGNYLDDVFYDKKLSVNYRGFKKSNDSSYITDRSIINNGKNNTINNIINNEENNCDFIISFSSDNTYEFLHGIYMYFDASLDIHKYECIEKLSLCLDEKQIESIDKNSFKLLYKKGKYKIEKKLSYFKYGKMYNRYLVIIPTFFSYYKTDDKDILELFDNLMNDKNDENGNNKKYFKQILPFIFNTISINITFNKCIENRCIFLKKVNMSLINRDKFNIFINREISLNTHTYHTIINNINSDKLSINLKDIKCIWKRLYIDLSDIKTYDGISHNIFDSVIIRKKIGENIEQENIFSFNETRGNKSTGKYNKKINGKYNKNHNYTIIKNIEYDRLKIPSIYKDYSSMESMDINFDRKVIGTITIIIDISDPSFVYKDGSIYFKYLY